MLAILKGPNISYEIILPQQMSQEKSERVPQWIRINSDLNPWNQAHSKLIHPNLSVLPSSVIENEEEPDNLLTSSSEATEFEDALNDLSDPLRATATEEAFELPTRPSLHGQDDLPMFSNGDPSSWLLRIEQFFEQQRLPSQI
ncbi:hypothetical protein ACLOJK_005119 [Asimina triloba]